MKNNNNSSFNIQDLLLFEEAAFVYNDPLNQRDLILKDLVTKSGIYCWFNTLNCKFYIGSSVSLLNRVNDYYQDHYYRDKKKSNNC